jgi:hypothetical protein
MKGIRDFILIDVILKLVRKSTIFVSFRDPASCTLEIYVVFGGFDTVQTGRARHCGYVR